MMRMYRKKPFYTVVKNSNWCSFHGRQYGGSPPKLKELPPQPLNPLLGIYQAEIKMNLKETFTFNLIAAFLTIINKKP